MMKKATVIYEEKRILTAKYCHPKSDDYLHYNAIIRIQADIKSWRGLVPVRNALAAFLCN
jgi:hypothetical protein